MDSYGARDWMDEGVGEYFPGTPPPLLQQRLMPAHTTAKGGSHEMQSIQGPDPIADYDFHSARPSMQGSSSLTDHDQLRQPTSAAAAGYPTDHDTMALTGSNLALQSSRVADDTAGHLFPTTGHLHTADEGETLFFL